MSIKKILYTLFFIIVIRFAGFSAVYRNDALGALNSTRTGGTCTTTTFPNLNLSNVRLSISSKNSATLTFSSATAGTTLNTTSITGTISGSTISFPNITATRGSCSATVSLSCTGISIGFQTFSSTINMTLTGSQTGSASATLSLRYYNVINPSGTLVSSGIINNAICSNSQFDIDIEGDHFGSAYIEIDGTQRGSIQVSEDNFNINKLLLRNSFEGLGLGTNTTTHTVRLILLNSNNTFFGSININTTIRTFTPYTNVALSANPANAISCYGQPITLSTNISGVGISGAGYTWSDGGSAVSSRTFVPTNQLSYSVTVTNNGVCPTTSNPIRPTVIPNVPAEITVSKSNPCVGETVTLTAKPNDTNLYDFNWSNNNTGNVVSINSNTTNLSVQITPKGCPGRTSAPVSISFTPAVSGVDIELPNNKQKPIFCKGETSMLLKAKAAEDLAGAGFTYQWSGQNSGNNSTLSITQPGNYTLVITKNGCGSAKTITVVGNQSPTISTTPQDLRICNGTTATFTVSPNDKNNFGYQWYKETTASTVAGATEPTFSAKDAGTYIVRLIPLGGNCAQFNEDNRVLQVDPTINGKLSPAGNAVICNTAVGLNLTASGDGTGINYLWNTGANTNTINVKTAGIFEVTMSRGKCSEKQSVTTTVQNLTATISNPANVIVCSGTNYQAYELKASSNFPTATFKWKLNTDNTDAPNATNSGTYLPTVAGDYYVFAEVASLGCSAPSSSNRIKVVVPASFAVNVSPLNPSNICDGENVVFTATPTYTSSLITYSWANSANTTKDLTTNVVGIYTANIVQEGCKASNSSELKTKPSKATITVVDQSLLVASDSPTYEWYYKKLPLSTNPADYTLLAGATQKQYQLSSILQSGAYILKGNRNGCGVKFSDPVEINYTITSTSPILIGSNLSIYPNPFTNFLEIDDAFQTQKSIELHDSSGKMLKSWQSIENKTKLDCSLIYNGIYSLVIISNGKKTTKKIIKM